MAWTAAGLTWSAGSGPAERVSIRSPALWRSQPAAIRERPAVWTQTNRTLGLSDIRSLQLEVGAATFEQDDVAPGAVMLADALADPDDPEARALVQSQARPVLGEHTGLHGPNAGL